MNVGIAEDDSVCGLRDGEAPIQEDSSAVRLGTESPGSTDPVEESGTQPLISLSVGDGQRASS
jgi:hypothetical protein